MSHPLPSQALSPSLVAGLLLRPLPPSAARVAAQPVLDRILRTLAPRLRDRLSQVAGSVAVIPAGWPLALRLTVGPGGMEAEVTDADAPADAVVRAPLEVLTGMLGGAGGLDGDAGMFSRLLTIEGDTGLVMALRYALEDADVDGRTLLDLLPQPLRPMVPRMAGRARRLHAAAARDLATLQQAMLAPLRADLARLEARVVRLEQDAARRRR